MLVLPLGVVVQQFPIALPSIRSVQREDTVSAVIGHSESIGLELGLVPKHDFTQNQRQKGEVLTSKHNLLNIVTNQLLELDTVVQHIHNMVVCI